MRVLLTATSFYPAVGGAQLHWHKICTLLLARGTKVSVVTQWTKNRTDWLIGTTITAPRAPTQLESEGVQIRQISPSLLSRIGMLPFVAAYHIVPEVASPALSHMFRHHLVEEARAADLVHNVRIGRDYFSWASYEAARIAGIRC